ncbi:FdhF/YdeP family oxidoreductase [Rosenbergiella australiborealis]|uniref:FdhF/YdeP family oxidoreductase n=1 Tax=Rosenbergiella australiborealis TaxID=1544696 RepID=UPI001F4D4841|nr:FdhF/YdeP family oxidoreductase [Rosenbergiella australiborealis]
MSNKRHVPGIHPYNGPAGGWGALKATAIAVKNQMDTLVAPKALLNTNQPDGFDCPGCAWPDKDHHSTFQFCENGAKAVTWEATSRRVTADFLSKTPVSTLLTRSDYELEGYGRLTQPLRYHAATDTLQPLSWEEAFGIIGQTLQRLPPKAVEFYTSGRTSNEAAYLYQLMVREYGCNNFPDCSNMCHEATSVGLPQSIGIGKGTVSLDDFDKTELIISIGHNPGTNHPRMMGTLHEAARRNVPIIVLNPMKERALERFADPQNPIEMATYQSTDIASSYYQVKAGGDAAALKGIAKAVLEADEKSQDVLDHQFIEDHTLGFAEFADDLRATSWEAIEQASGLPRESLTRVAEHYANSQATIITYGMGITQHQHGTENVQLIASLLLMRGNFGKAGAGICPLRGHSNVQGNRTVGISEKPTERFLQALDQHFGINSPREHGHDAGAAMEAIIRGESKALICLGGNFAVALPDPERCFPALKELELSVHIATKLNRSHLLIAKETLILPCLGRTEIDQQSTGKQSITVEDSMSMVHASAGKLKPASPSLRSEIAIVAGIAQATLPNSPIDYLHYVEDYGRIRDAIEATLPGFNDYNERIQHPGGFRMPLPPTQRQWPTPSGRAHFLVYQGLNEDDALTAQGALRLITLRSHDQYNTTLYGLDDRYRGVFGRRDVLFMNPDDMRAQGLEHGDVVDIVTALPDSDSTMKNITVIEYAIARGSVGAYYPEANILIPLSYRDQQSGTPAYKSVPVKLLSKVQEPA